MTRDVVGLAEWNGRHAAALDVDAIEIVFRRHDFDLCDRTRRRQRRGVLIHGNLDRLVEGRRRRGHRPQRRDVFGRGPLRSIGEPLGRCGRGDADQLRLGLHGARLFDAARCRAHPDQRRTADLVHPLAPRTPSLLATLRQPAVVDRDLAQ